MVYYFTSVTAGGTYTLYAGRDSVENELLIEFGLPSDIWFHVNDLSSAHIYCRLPDGQTINDIPVETLCDCAQLTKANSIQGSKKGTGRLRIIYTPWTNLSKDGSMSTGQVGFKNHKQCSYTHVDARDNAIINRLMKTRIEKPSDSIKADREAYEAIQRAKQREQRLIQQKAAVQEKKMHAEQKAAQSYDSIFDEQDMKSNAEIAVAGQEDDFM